MKRKKKNYQITTPGKATEMFKLYQSGLSEQQIADRYGLARITVHKHIERLKAKSNEIVLKDFTQDIQRIAQSVLETQTQGVVMLQEIMKSDPDSKNIKDCLYRINANNRMVTQSLQALGVTVPMRGGDSLNKPSSNIFNIFIKDVYVDNTGKSLEKKEEILENIAARRMQRIAHLEFARERNKERFGEIKEVEVEEVKEGQ